MMGAVTFYIIGLLVGIWFGEPLRRRPGTLFVAIVLILFMAFITGAPDGVVTTTETPL